MDDDRNLSTEHQREGDARRPSDTLDRAQSPAHSEGTSQPFMARDEDEEKRQNHQAVYNGNRLSEADAHDGVENQIHQSVENQSVVSPDDYPEKNGMRDADEG